MTRTQTNAQPLKLRLFLEGIEIPVISATVTMAPDSPATAAIQILPLDTGLELLPRTLVHLFFLQGTEGDGVVDSDYKLLFAGEVIGFNYSKNPSDRGLVLNCLDFSSYWGACYQWFADYSNESWLSDASAKFIGSGTGKFDNIASGHQWVIGKVINSRPKSKKYRRTTGLLGGLIHLMESISGIRYNNQGDPGLNGVNDFFTIAELRYNLLGMIGAAAADRTTARMFNDQAFLSWIKNGMTSMGTLLSFRDIINHLNQYVFHNVYPNTCAYYPPPSTETTVVTRSYRKDVNGSLLVTYLKDALKESIASQNWFAEVRSRSSTGGNTFSLITPYRNGLDAANKALDFLESAFITAEKLSTRDKNSILTSVKDARTYTNIVVTEGDNSQHLPLDVNEKAIKFGDLMENVSDRITDVIKPAGRVRTTRTQRISHVESHLYNQLFLPELFFVAPPACNVIFPDSKFQFTFSRSFLRETSRVMLNSGFTLIDQNSVSSKLLSRSYVAPNIKDSRGKLLYSAWEKGGRTLLPHEVHSGIIPKISWVSDGHRWAVKASRDTGRSPIFRGGNVGYLQRLANFHLYLNRWSARSMSAGGPFTPNLVLGLPGLVMNKSLPSAHVVKLLKDRLGVWAPTQYLGKVAYISHNVSQQGGTTNVRFTHARTHRGIDDEFLGALTREVQVSDYGPTEPLVFSSKKAVEDENKTYWPILRLQANSKLTPGVKVSGVKVTQVSVSEETTTFSKRTAGLLGIEDNRLTIIEGEPRLVLPTKFKLTVKKASSSRIVNIRTTVEEAIRPGYYSNVWTNQNIGNQAYKPLLGCQAITDGVTLTSDEQLRAATREISDPRSPNTGSYGILPGSIENSIDSLTTLYSTAVREGADIGDFVRQYTSRPIASLEDVLGSQNLQFTSSGEVDSSIAGAVEGYHSRAYGDYNADVQLISPTGARPQAGDKALHLLFPGAPNPANVRRGSIFDTGAQLKGVKPEWDPRGRARLRVKAYSDELSLGRGLTG